MRAWKWAAWTAAGLAALLGATWLGVPALAQWQLQTRGSEVLGRALQVQRVEFAPLSLALTLHGLSVAGPEGTSAPQLEIARLHVDADLRSLWRLAPVIEAVQIDAPRLRVARAADGRWDFEDVLDRLQATPQLPPAPDDEPTRFALFNVVLRDGEVRVDDRPVGKVHEFKGLQVGLPFLSNLPDDVAVTVEPRVAFAIDGHGVDLRGRALPFASDRASTLSLDVTDLDLARWWAYVPASAALRPEGGTLTAALALQFVQPAGQAPRVALSGRTTLRRLAAKNRSGSSMLGWETLAVEWKDVRPLERRIVLGAVTLDGADVRVRRDAQGRLEWARLNGGDAAAPAAATAASAAGASTSATSQPWRIEVDKVAVRGSRVHWDDDGVKPATAFVMEDLTLAAEGLRWPLADGLPLQSSVRVTAGGKTVARASVRAQASDRAADVDFEFDEVDIGAARPYVRAVLRPDIAGRAKATGRLEWAAGDAGHLRVRVQSLQVDGFRLNEAGQRQSALRWKTVQVSGAQVDLLAQKAAVSSLSVTQPDLRLRRDADGSVNAQRWAAAGPESAAAAQPSESRWRAELRDVAVRGGRVMLTDAAARPERPVVLDFNALNLRVRSLIWPAARSSARVDLATQLQVPAEPGATPEPPGKLHARGSLNLQPLRWRGQVDLERWPVAAFEPYVGDQLPIRLASAELGLQSTIDLHLAPQGVRLDAQGEALIADVRVLARADAASGAGEELMAWQSLTLKPLQVRMAPGAKPSVEIGEVQWSDFYSRLVISEDGRFNLRDVAAAKPQDAAVAAEGAASAASAPSAPAPAAPAASAPSTRASDLPIELVVGNTRLVNGRVDFTDRFIRPNYSAALSELNGTLGRIDSRTSDMATLELRGRAAGTALLEVRGALNPTADPLALDITARATDLELAPLTPYAGKYAGYAIERGKLSMDVAYRIDPDGKLAAKNQIILKQLTFGEKIDSPDATKLPVRFAVALLADRNGVIDIDLPISGSINDPQFSIWGIVWKLIGNLIAKALTAPFSLLAGAGGPDLSVVQFVPGTDRVAPESAAVLERVAKALADRPALRMTVTGAADPAAEREAMRSAVLEARIAAEQRRELARAGSAARAASAALPPLTPAARTAIVKRLYSDAKLPNKPRNIIGLAKDIPLAEMEALLKGAIVVTDDSARELAVRRGLAVRDALIAMGLPSERLFLGAPQVHAAADAKEAWSPRVHLKLEGP